MIKNGGYTMLDLATATYKNVAAAFNANKPILVYDNSQVYYADTCVYDSDNDAYVITKGGKTITIDSDNNVVSSGDILTIMENIVDSDGRKRFIESDLSTSTITGISFNYGKWSLSGSHLMIVLAGVIEENATISNGTWATLPDLPQWIFDKIVPTFSVVVEFKTQFFYGDDYSSQTMTISLYKDTDERVKIVRTGGSTTTFTKERNFRIQFDLLIDNE